MPGKKWPTKEVRLPSTLRRAPFAIHSSAPIRLLRVSVTLKVEGFRGLVRRESPRSPVPGRLGRERATRTRGRFGNLRYSRLGGLRYVGGRKLSSTPPQVALIHLVQASTTEVIFPMSNARARPTL